MFVDCWKLRIERVIEGTMSEGVLKREVRHPRNRRDCAFRGPRIDRNHPMWSSRAESGYPIMSSTERLIGPDPEGGFIDGENITESVEELRARLESMKKLLAESQRKNKSNRTSDSFTPNQRVDSLIDGNFLSAVFAIVFILIIGVSFYAFQNLYFAILKKFPAKHTEL